MGKEIGGGDMVKDDETDCNKEQGQREDESVLIKEGGSEMMTPSFVGGTVEKLRE